MTPSRREIVVGGTIALAAGTRVARAQSYPDRPIRLLVGFAPGGPNDILGRLITNWLTSRLGQPVIVDNLPGASGNRATEMAARAAPDGHTLLLIGPANAINVSLYDGAGFDFVRDIAPVGGITREPLVMVVHPSLPARTVADFIAAAKAAPGTLRMASTGNGSSPHVTGELFKMMAGVHLVVTHYAGGGPALKALIAGEEQMMFEPMSASIEPVRVGALRALAVTTAARSNALPDLPTMSEAVPGFEASATTGLGVPRDTPSDIVTRLNRDLNAAFADSAMMAKLADTGGMPLPGSPEDFGRLIAGEIEKWAKVLKASGAKPG